MRTRAPSSGLRCSTRGHRAFSAAHRPSRKRNTHAQNPGRPVGLGGGFGRLRRHASTHRACRRDTAQLTQCSCSDAHAPRPSHPYTTPAIRRRSLAYLSPRAEFRHPGRQQLRSPRPGDPSRPGPHLCPNPEPRLGCSWTGHRDGQRHGSGPGSRRNRAWTAMPTEKSPWMRSATSSMPSMPTK